MKSSYQKLTMSIAILTALLWGFAAEAAYADDGSAMASYRITIENLTLSQPLSPAVGATHRGAIRMFKVGKEASRGLEAIAEDGNQIPMFDRFSGSDDATSVFGGPGMPPLTPGGILVGDFTSSLSRMLTAQPGDKLSLATMLICTNDGFTGLDRVKLPEKGSRVYLLDGYDAGTEENTESSLDIVDPCSALGPVTLDGDPNGNINDDIETFMDIALHPGVDGGIGDLLSAHNWDDPVAKVTATRVSDSGFKFFAPLSGAGEVPIVESDASGRATFVLSQDEEKLSFELKVHNIANVVQAHIHDGLPDENGPVLVFMFGPADPPTGPVNGPLSKGVLSIGDLSDGFVDALRNGELYVNVHTTEVPSGEIRGQIGATMR